MGRSRSQDPTHFRNVRRFLILWNYPAAKLQSTFLFKYELPLIGKSCGTGYSQCRVEIEVLDFKAGCSENMLKQMEARIASHVPRKNSYGNYLFDAQLHARTTCRSPSDSVAFRDIAMQIKACERGHCLHDYHHRSFPGPEYAGPPLSGGLFKCMDKGNGRLIRPSSAPPKMQQSVSPSYNVTL